MAPESAFGPEHPLWHELLARRKAGAKVEDLVATAHERGYRSLSYRQVLRGLKSARFVEHLPDRSAFWLQQAFSNIGDDDLNAWDWLKGLAIISSEKLFTYQQELAKETESYKRLEYLAKAEGEERDRLTTLCRDIVTIEIKLGYRQPVAVVPLAPTSDINPDTMESRIADLAADLVGVFSGGKVRVTRVTQGEEPAGAPTVVSFDPAAELKLLGTFRAPGDPMDERDEGSYDPEADEDDEESV